MVFRRRYGIIVMATYLIAILIVGQSDGRELRPSEHGLAYQNTTATGEKTPEMMSFFGGSLSSASNVPLPEARNMSDSSSWWSDGGGRGRGEGGDHVKQVLLVTSLVCGITGVVLLVVAAFLFLFHFQKQRPPIPASSSISTSTSAHK